jgi:hypothetical protein
MLEAFGIALSITLTAAFSWWLWRSASRNVEPAANGRFHIRVHWIYVVLGFLGFVLGAIGLAVLIATPSNNVIQLVFPIIGAVIFWGSGLPCVLYYRNHMVWFDNTSITVSDVWGNLKTTSWNALRSIELRKYSGLLRITLEDGSYLSLNPHLVGLNQFLRKLEEKTNLVAPEISWKPM